MGCIMTCGAEITERVGALDWLSLRCTAIITLRVRTPDCAPKQGTSSVDRDVNVGPVGRN